VDRPGHPLLVSATFAADDHGGGDAGGLCNVKEEHARGVEIADDVLRAEVGLDRLLQTLVLTPLERAEACGAADLRLGSKKGIAPG